jgi:hypothetical protein
VTGLVVLLASIFGALALSGLVFGLWLHRKVVAGRAELAAELATEPAVRGPESGIYRGSTGSYSKVMGNGTIVLTARRVIFRKATGGRVDVALSDVTKVELQKVFNRGVVGNRVHLVLHTHQGAVGYFVGDPEGWVKSVEMTAGGTSAAAR